MTVSILFPDGTEVRGMSATHVLAELLGGWNTDKSIYALRHQLASRHGIEDNPDLSDLQFLHMMDCRGIWTVGYGPKLS